MLYVSEKTDTLTKATLQSLIKEKYLQASDELFSYLANNDLQKLQRKAQEFAFEELPLENVKNFTSIYSHKSELSSIEILQKPTGEYLLYMKYLDDSVLLSDRSQEKYLNEVQKLNYFIFIDILILIALFLIILKMLYPLKKIANNIQIFGAGKYQTRVDINTKDEIGELAREFNSMAKNIQELIHSREQLLRGIAHELKTPISKSKLALEMLEENKYTEILTRANRQMDTMTSELLNIEKLNANQHTLHYETFQAETLVLHALSLLFIENETDIQIITLRNPTITADFHYLSIALKNLIDNALKYASSKPIVILLQDKSIEIRSQGKQLKKGLDYYCEPFTQEESSRNERGYGLGLNLVQKILSKHDFLFQYAYKDKENIFILFITKNL